MKISKTLISKEEIENKISEIATKINDKYEEEELVVIGILKGAFIVVSDLAKQLQLDVTFDFMSIKSYYGSESSGQIKIVKDLEYDITDKNVLIVEDIVDTGLTLSWLKANLESRGAKSVEICTIFRKPEAAKVEVNVKYIGFDIPPAFIVGYGLDFNEKYRNLSVVAVLSPHMYS